jgi:hypothetical protein
MKKILLISLMLLFTTFSFAYDDNVPRYVNMENSAGLINPDGFFEYMIIKGDCLWFIADEFYSDSFKWTKIHEANPYIIDPDWIYPNNWLVIPNVYTDDSGKPIYSGASETIGDKTWVEETGTWGKTSKTWGGTTQIDLDGDGIVDGVDLDGDGIIDTEAGIDLDGDGVIDGYDLDGDGEIDVKSSAAIAAAYGVDSDGDGNIDGVDLNGDGIIDDQAGIDIDSDGVIDGYDVDGDGIIDVKAETAALTASDTATTSVDTDKKDHKCDETHKCDKPCSKSYCGKPGWKLGLHAGYPVGGGPEDENLNLGLLLGTPLGVKVGPLSVGLGAGAFTYDFDNLYFGGGLLASLCINDLLKLDIPLILQLHGIGFYIFGEDQGLGIGAIGSGSVPLGKSPLSIGLYGALGKYYPNENDYNWSNVGAILFYTL